MQKMLFNIERYQIANVRKDEHLRFLITQIQNILNKGRTGKYKPLSWIATRAILNRAGFKTEGQISILLGSVKDANNPTKALWWKLKNAKNV